jgi:hypothetical protein
MEDTIMNLRDTIRSCARPALAAFFGAVTLGQAAAMDAMGIKTQSDLRTALNLLFAEHVSLAADATGWAMMGHNRNFEAAAGALDANSQAIAGAVGLVYGKDAGDAFLPLWRKHIGFFVDYTTATVKHNMAGRKKAVDDLTAYAQDFGAFLNSANPDLPQQAVADLVVEHAKTLLVVIDAQADQNWVKAYQSEREAVMHMQHIGDALAGAISKQFPDKFM